MSGGFAQWAIDAMIASTLLMGVVLLMRGPVRRAFGPQVAYALWALPLLRLVLPPLPAGWRASAAMPIERAGETLVLIVQPAVVPADPTAPGLLAAIGAMLAITWAIGAAAFLGYHLVKHVGFCRRIVAHAATSAEAGGICILTSDAAPGPLAFGIWRRYIAFPLDFVERYDADERALALAHEIGHHQRGDLIANWAALAMLALHWFDPLAWRAFRAFRVDQELANDARILAGCSARERHVYACAIVKAAQGGAVSVACHFNTIADLKGRLKMLAASHTSRRRLASGAAAIAVLAVAGLGLTASGSSAAAISGGIREAVQAAPVATSADAATAALDSATADRDSATAAADSATAAADSAGTAATSLGAAKQSTRLSSDVKRVVIVKDGKTTTYTGGDADRYVAEHALPVPPVPPVPGTPTVVFATPAVVDGKKVDGFRITTPEVRSELCDGDARQTFRRETRGGRERLIICTNHIAAMTSDAQLAALNADATERGARLQARSGLSVARVAIEGNRELTDAQRRQALAGIATAEAELSGDND